MKVIAWNRSPKTAPGVTFVDLETLLAEAGLRREDGGVPAPLTARREAGPLDVVNDATGEGVQRSFPVLNK